MSNVWRSHTRRQEELDEEIDVWPSTAESELFIADYEEERGTPFDAAERTAVRAACVYLRAYAARCHHAYGGDARKTGLADLASALLVAKPPEPDSLDQPPPAEDTRANQVRDEAPRT